MTGPVRSAGCWLPWLHGFGDRPQQAVRFDRLRQVAGASGVPTLPLIAGHGVGRQGDNRRRATLLPQFTRRTVAVHHGHLHVHEDQVERFGQSQFDADAAVFRERARAGAFQDQADEFAVRDSVIDDQDAAARKRGSGDRPTGDRLPTMSDAPSCRTGTPSTGPVGSLSEKILPRPARSWQLAAEQVGETPTDRQAEPRAAESSRNRTVRLHERIEDALDPLAVNSDSGVDHVDDNLRNLSRLPAGGHLHAADFGKRSHCRRGS